MSESIAEDFKRRVQNNGVKVKNVPNVQTEGDVFRFGDYVSKDPGSWAYVPADSDSVDVEALAEDMYDVYESLADFADEVSLERTEDEMYWADVTVEVPEDASRRERVAEEVAEAILQRQQM